ncbi:hypothetical protein MY04_5284 [Flammeovirga sp. MY04]|uniref:hypothetical protein n=1 Tax=Flammeovirga sp. MY04 TaxID=1191459 RepID=UPI0008241E53|nr:hypothetical protein [Flammeovirga sp. MY04]ANQ52616.2 hypothetical protein MY04_5284 [Flammeovirga sp. MY04]
MRLFFLILIIFLADVSLIYGQTAYYSQSSIGEFSNNNFWNTSPNGDGDSRSIKHVDDIYFIQKNHTCYIVKETTINELTIFGKVLITGNPDPYNVTIKKDFNLEPEGLIDGESLHGIIVKGNCKLLGKVNHLPNIYFKPEIANEYNLEVTNSRSYNNINFNFDGVKNSVYFLKNDLNLNGPIGNIYIKNCEFNLNENKLIIPGSKKQIFVQTGGKLSINDGSKLYLSGRERALVVEKEGELSILGQSSNYSTIEGYQNRYSLDVYGKISAKYYHISDLTGDGITLKNGSEIDPLFSFDFGIFDQCFSKATLNIEANVISDDLQIDEVTFNTNNINISRKTNEGGKIYFRNTKGLNIDSENDPFDLIEWISTKERMVWQGNSSNWFDPSNWSNSEIPNATSNIFIDAKSYDPIIKVETEVNSITIAGNASLTLEKSLVVVEEITLEKEAQLIFTPLQKLILKGDAILFGNISGDAFLSFILSDKSQRSFSVPKYLIDKIKIDIGKGNKLSTLSNLLNVNTLEVNSGLFSTKVKGIAINEKCSVNDLEGSFENKNVTLYNVELSGGTYHNLEINGNVNVLKTIGVTNSVTILNTSSSLELNNNNFYLSGHFNNQHDGKVTQSKSATTFFNGTSQDFYGSATFGSLEISGNGNKNFKEYTKIKMLSDFKVIDQNSKIRAYSTTGETITVGGDLLFSYDNIITTNSNLFHVELNGIGEQSVSFKNNRIGNFRVTNSGYKKIDDLVEVQGNLKIYRGELVYPFNKGPKLINQ